MSEMEECRLGVDAKSGNRHTVRHAITVCAGYIAGNAAFMEKADLFFLRIVQLEMGQLLISTEA